MARIERVEITKVDIAPPVTRIDATQQVTAGENVLVEVFADDGSSGLGYTVTIGTGGSAIAELIRADLAPRLIGADPAMVEQIWKTLYGHIFYLNVGGITAMALAAIDIALWDLRCRRAGLPLHVMAGGAKDRVAMYNTEYGWLQLSRETLTDGAARIREEGFRGMKIKVGRPHVSEDVARVAAVRAALGDELDLMVDANKAWTVGEAILRTAAFGPYGLAWMEEPLPMEDVNGHQQLARSTTTPIAIGETLYHPGQFREYLQRGACSIIQADVTRVGGITPWLKIAHLAESFNVPVCPHSLMEIHLPLCCAVPNAPYLEYMPHIDPITAERPRMQDGHALASREPGLGIVWDRDAIRRLRSNDTTLVVR